MKDKARAVVTEWRTVLQRRQEKTRQMIRRLLVGRLSFEYVADRRWRFTGCGTVREVLSGIVTEDYLMRWRPQPESVLSVSVCGIVRPAA
jgi:hypothetical protein